MELARSPWGGVWTRKYLIGATLIKGQVVCWAGLGGNGVIGDPTNVNTYGDTFGVSNEAATYSTTQGAADVLAEINCDPLGVWRGHVSGGVASNTAWTNALDGNLLVAAGASAGGTAVADTDVGTSEYLGGYLVCLSGANKGQVRMIDAHADNTSTSVVCPFDSGIAIGDTFLRTFGPGLQGLELTTTFEQFNGCTGAGVDLPDTGQAVAVSVLVDKQIADLGNVEVRNATNPNVDVEFVFVDHVWNSVA